MARAFTSISVFYIDFGNSEVLTDGASRLAALPSVLASVPPQANAFRLAGVALPPDEDDVKAAVEAFQVICYQGMIAVNSEYELEGCKFASVVIPKVVDEADASSEASGEKSVPVDVAEKLLEDGYVYVEPTMVRGREAWRMKTLVKRYQSKEDNAKKGRRNIWRYGDFRGEENL